MGANDPNRVAKLDPWGIIGRAYVEEHLALRQAQDLMALEILFKVLP